MITVSAFIQVLKPMFPGVKFYNGAINREEKQNVGVYARGRGAPFKAIGGAANTSYSTLPVTLLVHWTENSDECERKANAIYSTLFESEGLTIGSHRVITIQMLDSAPIDMSRTDENVCEMIIRANILYEREVL